MLAIIQNSAQKQMQDLLADAGIEG